MGAVAGETAGEGVGAVRAGRGFSRERVVRHVLLGLLGLAVTMGVYRLTPPPDWRHRLSMGSAYAAMLFLVWSRVLGPWNVLRRRSNPVSFDLRRDVSLWAGSLAVLHTGVGLTVHLRGRMWMYFFKRLHPLHLQNTAFGAANYTGLFAALLFAMLLLISNDLSLRGLGARRWKRWQRWAYAAATLTVVHGVIFQGVEARHVAWRAVLYLGIGLVLAMQMAGVAKVTQK